MIIHLRSHVNEGSFKHKDIYRWSLYNGLGGN